MGFWVLGLGLGFADVVRMQLIDHLDLEFGEFTNCIRIHLLLLSHFPHDPQSHIFSFFFFFAAQSLRTPPSRTPIFFFSLRKLTYDFQSFFSDSAHPPGSRPD